ncbi:filamin-binding LIM protein 1 [Eudromia elegans]
MLPGKRLASSVYITLAPPARAGTLALQGTRTGTLQAPSAGAGQLRNEEGLADREPSQGVCAFCHKGVGRTEAAIEAMGRQYHAGCFMCRTCQRPLAAQRYYQRDGRPCCAACYEATLERCAKCRVPVAERVVRALGRGYHPGCFVCAACGRALCDESFAAGEGGQPFCVDDFYRRYAATCGACGQPIVPHDGRDTYKIECLGRCFHESCYCCERCRIPLSPEPTEDGCYPLGDRLLCKACHVAQRDESSC